MWGKMLREDGGGNGWVRQEGGKAGVWRHMGTLLAVADKESQQRLAGGKTVETPSFDFCLIRVCDTRKWTSNWRYLLLLDGYLVFNTIYSCYMHLIVGIRGKIIHSQFIFWLRCLPTHQPRHTNSVHLLNMDSTTEGCLAFHSNAKSSLA